MWFTYLNLEIITNKRRDQNLQHTLWTKTHVIYLKRKLRTWRIKIQVEKVWFVPKTWKNLILKKNSNGPLMSERPPKKFQFFKISKFFFEKWHQWDMANVQRNKVMKFELILSIHRGITRDHLPGGIRSPPPLCRIGLKLVHLALFFFLLKTALNELKCNWKSLWKSYLLFWVIFI